jgi:transcriptional regulator with XRE-family HTH domain
MSHAPSSYSYSAAALVLMAAGVTLPRIADALDTTPASVSRWLKGQYPPHPELFVVIAAIGGRPLADKVRALVPSAVSA